MPSKIEEYVAAKREQDACLEWAALIGSTHSDGSGIGVLKHISLAEVTVYCKRLDSYIDHHQIPIKLTPYLCTAIKARFGELLADALARQELALKAVAAEALEEHSRLLQAAGLAGADRPNDMQGRTQRQVNAEKTRAIPLGALVELKTGERLRVMMHTWDCDRTPLYSVGVSGDDEDPINLTKWRHGYCDESLMVVTPNA